MRALDRSTGELHVLDTEACLFDYRSSVFKRDPGRWLVLGVSLALEPTGVSEPIRYAELAGRLGVEVGRARAAWRRCARPCSRCGGARAWCSTPPTRTRSAPARSSRTRSCARATSTRSPRGRRERLGADVAPPAWPGELRTVKTSAAWLIERAGFARGYGNPEGIAISSKHTLALTNRGGGTTAELVALAREIAGGVHDAFGVELVPEPVFAGHAWEPLGERPARSCARGVVR